MLDVASVIASIPLNVPRTHHGRSPQEGFDCVGLPIWVYGQCGIPLDDCDFPYTRTGAARENLSGRIERQLARRLRDVTPLVASNHDEDGDVWVFDVGDGLRHAGVYCGGLVYHMAEVLRRVDAFRVRPLLKNAFRV